MEQLTPIAFAVALFGGIFDLLTKRIPNWWTFPAMAIGLIAQTYLRSGAGALDSSLAIIVALFLYLPIYVVGAMGAGDIKLLMAIGAWTNPRFVFCVAIIAVFIGGSYALIDVLWNRRLGAMVENVKRLFWVLVPTGLPRERLDIDRTRKFSFGAAIALAVPGTILYLQRSGL